MAIKKVNQSHCTVTTKTCHLVYTNFIPFVDFIFVNLGTISNEELLDLSDDILIKSTFLTLKNVQDANFIKSHFNAFVNFFSNNPNYKNYLKKVLVYLYNHSAIKRDEFNSLIASQTNKSLKMNLTVAKGLGHKQ